MITVRTTIRSVAASILLLLTGCSSSTDPQATANLTGSVVELAVVNDVQTRLTVQPDIPSEGVTEPFWVFVDQVSTTVRYSSGESAQVANITVGQHVSVWILGTFLGSQPPQATAQIVEIDN